MKPIIGLLLMIICFWSIITTFRAIYLILTNEFNGSKKKWILISLIGIVGPFMWITKGKKLLINKTLPKRR